MFSAAKNTKQQGTIGLGAVISYYATQACTVSVPLNDSQDYDLVIDRGGTLFKVSVKTSRYKNKFGRFVVLLAMNGGNRKANYVGKLSTDMKFDILFVLTADGVAYELPRSEIAHITKSMTLSAKYEKFRIVRA